MDNPIKIEINLPSKTEKTKKMFFFPFHKIYFIAECILVPKQGGVIFFAFFWIVLKFHLLKGTDAWREVWKTKQFMIIT